MNLIKIKVLVLTLAFLSLWTLSLYSNEDNENGDLKGEETSNTTSDNSNDETSDWLKDLKLQGFFQTGYSVRVTGENPEGARKESLILGEERSQLKASLYPHNGNIGIFLKSDFYHDWVKDDFKIDFREGYLDFIESKFSLRLGRQIITWGVGDLLFINDIFPKDWEALYSGRPLEYLKIGVDSIKLNIYSEVLSLEIIGIPFFKSDNIPSKERFHFFDLFPNVINRKTEKPPAAFNSSEIAARLYGNIGNFDVSFYFYKGFYRIPSMSIDNPKSPSLIYYSYPELAVYGFSIQKSALGGVISAEYGYYDSLNDRDGKDPLIENSKSKFLFGYQKALPDDLNLGFQYYAEYMNGYKNYEKNLPPIFSKSSKLHQYWTMRITKYLRYQTLKLSLFSFYSPDDKDSLIMPSVSYNFTDNIIATIGANIFGGSENTTFGQNKKDDNLYWTMRFNFSKRN